MNPGTFQGAGTGVLSDGAISGFQQTPVILSSQTITPPPGTKQIHALLAGGGGGGGADYDDGQGTIFYGNAGGFGGCAIFNIPVTTDPIQVIIGAGGSGGVFSDNFWPVCVGGNGGTTMIRSGGITWARVGGGGGGGSGFVNPAGSGRFGGGGGAGTVFSNYQGYAGGNGGEPPIGQMLWYLYPPTTPNGTWYANTGIGYSNTQYVSYPQMPQGTGFNTFSSNGNAGYFGGGGSGANATNQNNNGYGGGGWSNPIGYGGGARANNQPAGFGGEVIWGRPVGTVGGSGGPGVFGNSTSVNGGAGGGGGAGFTNGGAGGSGGAVLRFYY